MSAKLEVSAEIKRGDTMQDYKANLKSWANLALSHNEKESQEYNKLTTNLCVEEAKEMLAVLAGYLGATKQGRQILENILQEF